MNLNECFEEAVESRCDLTPYMFLNSVLLMKYTVFTTHMFNHGGTLEYLSRHAYPLAEASFDRSLSGSVL